MTADIIDGRALAASLSARVAAAAIDFKDAHGVLPTLAIVLVGDDPASHVYLRAKSRHTADAGMATREYLLPADTSHDTLFALIEDLNRDKDVHGIFLEVPLPPHIEPGAVQARIDPAKDVDGAHPVNAGKLWTGDPAALIPCTPYACHLLLKDRIGSLSGLKAAVIGRSNIVGKPMAALLLLENATVSILHSQTRDLPARCREADILVAAAGRPHLVQGNWIKSGATVLDVGINRVATPGLGAGGMRVVGDVDFEAALAAAGAVTPVPGGVGPVTICCLLRNTLIAAHRQRGLPDPDL